MRIGAGLPCAAAAGLLHWIVAWWALRLLPGIPGTDGYYLLVQAHSVLSSGHLKILDGNVLPFAIAGMMRFGVLDLQAVFITLALVHAVFAASVWAPFLQAFRLHQVILSVPCLIALTTIGLYHAVEFPKLTMAMALVPWWSIRVVARPAVAAVAFAAALLAFLVHHATLVLTVLWFLLWYRHRFWHVAWDWRILLGVGTVLAGFLASVVYLEFRDPDFLAHWSESVRGDAPGLWVFFHRNNLAVWLQVEVAALCTVLLTLLIVLAWRRRLFESCCLLLGLAAALLPSPSEQMFGLGERFVLIIALAAVPLLSVVIPMTEPGTSMQLQKSPSMAVVFICIVASFLWEGSVLRDAVPHYDYGLFRRVVRCMQPLHPTMLIAFRPLAFFYTAATGRDAFFFDPETEWPRAEIWRVVFDVRLEEILYFAGSCSVNDLVPIPATEAFAVRESCWQSVRSQISAEDLPGLHARVWKNERNPSTPRPVFLRKRNH